jgi:hypothetical protein
VRIEVDIGESDIIGFYAHELGETSRLERKVTLITVVVVCSFVGLAFSIGVLIGEPPPGGWLGPIVTAVLLALFLIWHFWFGRTWYRVGYPTRVARNLLTKRYARTMLGKQTVEITDRGVQHTASSGHSDTKWHAIEKIEATGDGAYIYVGPSQAIVIPRKSFPDDQAYEEFIATARRFHEAAPGFESRCPDCGYDLTGLSSGGCPECGWKRQIVPEESSPSSS